jgi:inhibitor of cysteine peptidase
MFKYNKVKKVLFIMIPLVLVLSLSSCIAAGKMLTEENNGDSIILEINDVIDIKLESNPTTGYGWALSEETDDSIISLNNSEFVESEKDKELVGSGGHEIFSFKAISKGKTIILLNYERPWEEEEEPVKAFELTVSVD